MKDIVHVVQEFTHILIAQRWDVKSSWHRVQKGSGLQQFALIKDKAAYTQ